MRNFLALVSGALFGIGLTLSGMTNPGKVIGFLDVTGRWDPSLALVMAGALSVSLIFFRLATRWQTPLAAKSFVIPKQTEIDSPLIIGSILFGIGWGLGGFCPGPALVSCVFGLTKPLIFAGAMVAGMLLFKITSIRP